MSAQSETVTVRLDRDTKSRLEELALHTRRTKSFLAGEAIADYVGRELAIIEGIKNGVSEIEAGHVTSHKDAMRRVRATIERASNS